MNIAAAIPSPAANAGVPEPYARLFAAFEQAGLAWCCWKSAKRLAAAYGGRGDLDLLIARADRQEATRLFAEGGFKHAVDAPGRDDPAMMSFVGFDARSGLLLHVHAHFRLILGPPLFKNDRLPCEKAFLARRRVSGEGPPLLAAADAALLLFVRSRVERGWLDPVWLKTRDRSAAKFREDFAALRPALDAEALRRSAAAVFDADLAERVTRQVLGDDPFAASSGLRRRVRLALAPYRLCGGFEASLRRVARAAMFLFGAANRRMALVPRSWGRRAPGGGVLVACVGVDGSGKSTAAAMLRAWLGSEVDVLGIYFGTGDGAPSLLLAPFKAVAGVVARLIRTRPKGASHGRISDRPPGPLYAVMFAVWAVAVALDKRHKLILAQRALRRGFVVVTDRYPQDEIASFNDGPLLPRLPRAPEWLRRFERDIYARVGKIPPDLVLKLHVGAETVARREPDMQPALIDERLAAVRRLRFQETKIVDVDARAPLDAVMRAVKSAVWNVL